MRFTNDFSDGVGYFAAGVKSWGTRPKLMLLGAIPAVIVSALMFALVAWAVPRTYSWASALTGFADEWALLFREGARISLGIAFAIAIVMFCIVSFVTITLTVGGPFYEQIWKATEKSLGFSGGVQLGLTQQVSKGVGDMLRMLAMALKTS
ncbi:MAG: hypothetical protein GX596_08870, partial [Propionibacterium sp.]|nr:hypothetical protein [Propionibacterium sp.]